MGGWGEIPILLPQRRIMSDFPVGIYRTQTANETISNWKGLNPGNLGGAGAVRVFGVFLSCLVTGANAYVRLCNGVSAASTATNYIIVRCDITNENYFESGYGVLFPNGCFITTGAAIDFATITFSTELA